MADRENSAAYQMLPRSARRVFAAIEIGDGNPRLHHPHRLCAASHDDVRRPLARDRIVRIRWMDIQHTVR